MDKAQDSETPTQNSGYPSTSEEPIITTAVSTDTAKETNATNTQENNSTDKPGPGRISRGWHFVKDPKHSGAVMAIFTVLIFATNAAYVVFSALQFGIMSRTLEDNKRVLAATSGAICNAVMNSRDRVPRIFVEIGCEAGKVDGQILGGSIEVALRNPRTNELIGSAKTFTIPQSMARPGQPVTRVDIDVAGFSGEEFAARRQAIVVNETFAYNDGFDRIFHAHFCQEALPFRDGTTGIYSEWQMMNLDCTRLTVEDTLLEWDAADEKAKQQSKSQK